MFRLHHGVEGAVAAPLPNNMSLWMEVSLQLQGLGFRRCTARCGGTCCNEVRGASAAAHQQCGHSSAELGERARNTRCLQASMKRARNGCSSPTLPNLEAI